MGIRFIFVTAKKETKSNSVRTYQEKSSIHFALLWAFFFVLIHDAIPTLGCISPTFFTGLDDLFRQTFPLAVLRGFISALVGGFFFHLYQRIIAKSYRTPAEAPSCLSEDDKAIRAAVYEALADLEKRTAEGEPVDYTTVIKMPHGHEVELRATAGYGKEGGKERKAVEAKTVPKEVASAG